MNDRIAELRYILDHHPDNTHRTLRPFIPRICADLGVNNATLYRWLSGKHKPRKRHIKSMIPVVEKYMKEIEDLKKQGYEKVIDTP